MEEPVLGLRSRERAARFGVGIFTRSKLQFFLPADKLDFEQNGFGPYMMTQVQVYSISHTGRW